MQLDTEIYLSLRELTQFPQSTLMTPRDIFSPYLLTSNAALSFPNTQRWSSLNMTPAYDCVSVFHISCCSFPLSKTQWGDIWVTAGCEVEHQAPPERPESARGRDVMMCQPASHHVWLPARQRSPAKSVYIIDRMKNSNLSQMQSVHWDKMGVIYCMMFSPVIKPFQYEKSTRRDFKLARNM